MKVIDLNASEGAQMTPGAARVIDPVLTSAARGYQNAKHIWPFVFPRVSAGARGGRLIEFDRTAFRLVNTIRAPGATTQKVQFGHTGEKYALDQHRLGGLLPVEPAQEAATIGVDMSMQTVDGTMNLISLSREVAAAKKVFSSATYDASHVTALAGDKQWSHDDSDPSAAIMDAVEAVRSDIGLRPNTVVLGAKVYARVRKHPKIKAELSNDRPYKIANLEDLARLWDVERVVSGDGVYIDNNDDSPADIWGKFVAVVYTAVGTFTRALPSFGLGYTLLGTPAAEPPYYDGDTNSWVHPCVEEWSNEVVGKDAGYLYTSVIT